MIKKSLFFQENFAVVLGDFASTYFDISSFFFKEKIIFLLQLWNWLSVISLLKLFVSSDNSSRAGEDWFIYKRK